MTVRVRLAPSPTGNLHIGTARTALFNWLFAKSKGGKFLLRIEDTDQERSSEEFTKNIFEGLQWLGLTWDERPIRQSDRIKIHRQVIQTLLDRGLAYRCYATEAELEEMRSNQKAMGEAPRYDNRHRGLTIEQQKDYEEEGRTSVIRFRIDDNEIIEWNDMVRGRMVWKGSDLGGDMVLSRRSPSNTIGAPLYNLVVVVDDSEMQISHVIRGEDHLANTAKQLAIYKALELSSPVFAHTPLILNTEGRKLSKRDGVTSISDFKEMGYTPEAIANYMALLGWSVPEGMDERFTIEEAAKVFHFDRVNKAGAKFDWGKLNWLNGQIIHQWDPQKLLEEINPIWEKEGWIPPETSWAIALVHLLGPSLTLTSDSLEQSRPFFEIPPLKDDGLKQLKLEGATTALNILLEKLNYSPWDGLEIKKGQSLLEDSANAAGIKKGLMMKTLRAALFGELQGPDLLNSWSLLARVDKDRSRIRRCL